jgi:hypothetical protein
MWARGLGAPAQPRHAGGGLHLGRRGAPHAAATLRRCGPNGGWARTPPGARWWWTRPRPAGTRFTWRRSSSRCGTGAFAPFSSTRWTPSTWSPKRPRRSSARSRAWCRWSARSSAPTPTPNSSSTAGFEILPQVHTLPGRWRPNRCTRAGTRASRNTAPCPADRDWLLAQLRRCRDEYKLPVIAIDYVPPARPRDLARETAQQIKALGFIPWVTNPALDMLGVGAGGVAAAPGAGHPRRAGAMTPAGQP